MKKYKRVFIFIFLILSTIISSEELNEKEQELLNIKSAIEKKKIDIDKFDKQKKNAEKDKNQIKKKVNQNSKKAEKFKNEELKIKDKIGKTEIELSSTTSKISQLENQCKKEVYQLMLIDYKSLVYKKSSVEQIILTGIINSTCAEIRKQSDRISSLSKIRTRQEKDIKDSRWLKIVARKNLKKYNKEVTKLEKKIVSYDEKKRKFLKEIKELEENAKAMESLIAKLKLEMKSQEYSFEFSTPKLKWPCEGNIIRQYGKLKNKEYNVYVVNNGIDISTPEGTEIKAIDDGIVIFSERFGHSGKLVIIDHQNGFYSSYAHNKSLLVSKGDKIHQQQPIAISGKTGKVNEPSLHFELRKKGKPVNPMDYLE